MIRSEFASHDISDVGQARIAAIRDAFSALLTHVEDNVPPGHEHDLVVTKLQEACMFAVRGVAVDPSVQRNASPAAVLADQMRRGEAKFGGS
jgi:hypothetical protein